MQILNPDNAIDRNRWLQLWQASGKEPFAHPGYVELYAGEDTKARCALHETNAGLVFYPFLLRSIPGEIRTKPATTPAFDIISPYGYGGPLPVEKQPEKVAPDAANATPSFQKEQKTALFNGFYRDFHRWACENNIISEFVRFFLFSEAREHYYGLVEYNNDNVVCDLQRPEEALWKSLQPKVRRRVRSALKRGLMVEQDVTWASLNDFIEVYYSTMRRLNAKSFYYFPKAFFESLKASLGEQCQLFNVRYENQTVASMLLLTSESRVYSFLSGGLRSFFHLSGNDLLQYHSIRWALESGFRIYVMGGGYQRNDGIFAFKEAFAPGSTLPFYTGKTIFNQDAYDSLSAGKAQDTGFFPAYRVR